MRVRSECGSATGVWASSHSPLRASRSRSRRGRAAAPASAASASIWIRSAMGSRRSSFTIVASRGRGRTSTTSQSRAAAGSGVIDAKTYAGKVRRVNKGWPWRRDPRLMVGSRDCTHLASAMSKQVEAVRYAMGSAVTSEFGVVVRPALCFVDAERSLLTRPFELEGVWIGWRRPLGRLLQAPGPLRAESSRSAHATARRRAPTRIDHRAAATTRLSRPGCA